MFHRFFAELINFSYVSHYCSLVLLRVTKLMEEETDLEVVMDSPRYDLVAFNHVSQRTNILSNFTSFRGFSKQIYVCLSLLFSD